MLGSVNRNQRCRWPYGQDASDSSGPALHFPPTLFILEGNHCIKGEKNDTILNLFTWCIRSGNIRLSVSRSSDLEPEAQGESPAVAPASIQWYILRVYLCISELYFCHFRWECFEPTICMLYGTFTSINSIKCHTDILLTLTVNKISCFHP